MKPTTLLQFITLLTTTTVFADKTCTPSFDYCAVDLIQSHGFTESDLETALDGTDLANDDLNDILFHCTNPGQVGHAKLCSSGCTLGQSGSHGC